jgi:hypothetical protein
MGAFEYTALDAGGKERRGILEGDTPRHIRQLLREKQLLPVAVSEVAQKEAKRQRTFSLARGVSASDLSLFTRQLATLVRAGLPLEESLLAVSQQTEKPRIQSIVLGVRARVMEGHTLADGFTEYPRIFPEIYRATVAAGEQAGHLDNVLERLADYTEGREQIRQKILAAMLYPIVLSVMCFAIVTGLLDRGDPVPTLAAQPGRAPAIRSVPAQIADRRQARTRLQHGALHAHIQHPLGKLSTRARSPAHCRGGRDEPADARRRGGCGGPGPRRSADRPLARGKQAVPADDHSPDLER